MHQEVSLETLTVNLEMLHNKLADVNDTQMSSPRISSFLDQIASLHSLLKRKLPVSDAAWVKKANTISYIVGEADELHFQSYSVTKFTPSVPEKLAALKDFAADKVDAIKLLIDIEATLRQILEFINPATPRAGVALKN